MAIIDKIYMRSQIGFDWPKGRVMLACVSGTDHFHLRFGGPAPYSRPPSWPGHGGYANFVAPPMDPLAVPHMMPFKHLEKQPFILVMHTAPMDDPFWNEVYKGAQTCANRRDIDLKIEFPKTPGDVEAHISLLSKAMAAKPVAIATTCPDLKCLLPILRKIEEQGIPLILFSSKTNRIEPSLRNAYPAIGIDDYRIGQLIAIRMLKSGQVADRVLVVASSSEGPVSHTLRFEGLTSILEQKNIKSNLITINTANSASGALVQQHLNQHPDTTAIVFLHGLILKQSKEFIADYMREAKRNLYLTTFDKPYSAIDMMRAGTLDFFIDCRPFLQGYLALMYPFKNYRIRPQVVAGKNKHTPAQKAALS